MKCPCCKKSWPWASEQGVCIEWHSECVACRFTPMGCGTMKGTDSELEGISREAVKRQSVHHPSPTNES
jgi:hypothetical protein